MRLYRTATALCLVTPALSLGQTIPPELRQGLSSEFHFSPDELAQAEAGKAVAHIVPTGRPDDVRLAGLVFIKVSSKDFIEAFRDIEHFETSREVIRTGRFSSPPVESDLTDFHTSALKKSEVLACHPGRCSYKLPAEAMAELQTAVDWSAPDAAARAEAFVHKRLVSYVHDYQSKGDSALAVYYDTPSPYSVAEGLHSLIGLETPIAKLVPDLVRFTSEYPANRPANTEDFLYWQEASFGLKHVLRAQHVILQRLPTAGDPNCAIISKMLFATHYFRAAIEFKYVYAVHTLSGEPAIYLVSAQRSYVHGMTGVKGAVIRRVAEGRSPGRLAENLQLAKRRLEHP